VNSWTPEIVIYATASTPAEARFCLEYSLAVALVDGDATLSQFTMQRVGDPEVQAVSRRIHVHADPELMAYADEGETLHYASFPAVVTIETMDGRTFIERVDLARGTARDPFTPAELDAKFLACATSFDTGDAHALLATARSLWSLDDVSALAAAGDLAAAGAH
jgi:2-methylcitrate dehydratase PrpD